MVKHDDHDHQHNRARKVTRPLMMALAITLVFALVELFGGLLSGSLALISDSGHMFTDVIALALSLWAGFIATRMGNENQTFGLLRVEILVALINGVILGAVSLFIMYEAVLRVYSPQAIDAGVMLIIAIIGLAANIAGVLILREDAKENLNVKGAFLHVLGDMLSSIGVIVAALLIYFFGLTIADPIISFAISLIILYGAYRIIKQSVYILLEFAPGEVDIDLMMAEMKKVPGVLAVHDIHVWTLGSGIFALSAHVEVEDRPVSACSCILRDMESLLKDKFNISHTTLQLEYELCKDDMCVFRQPGGPRQDQP
jgi:cobalt-zinc-cadmium efflux system protein